MKKVLKFFGVSSIVAVLIFVILMIDSFVTKRLYNMYNDVQKVNNDNCIEVSKFTTIEVDNSGTLNTNKVRVVNYAYMSYAYLNDTGIVYVGVDIENSVNEESWGTPVISPNGNYYIYNTETKSVEEVVK